MRDLALVMLPSLMPVGLSPFDSLSFASFVLDRFRTVLPDMTIVLEF